MSNNQTGIANEPNSTIKGYGISYSITAIFSALLVVLKESSETVHGLMVALTGHHWVTHGVLNLILFVALGVIFSRQELNMSGNMLIKLVVGSTILSGLIIATYFIL